MVKKSTWLLIASLLCSTAFCDELISYGSAWKYMLGTTEASSPDTAAWRQNAFDDSLWSSGTTPIGYTTNPNNPAESSIVTALPTSSEGNYLSVFLRRDFVVQNPARISKLTLNVNVDDGYIAWINGVEVARYNLPDGEPTYDSIATTPAEPPVLRSDVLPASAISALVSGSNVLAIQLFNVNRTSSDLLLDASLLSDADETPPFIAGASPTPGAKIPELTTIEVNFNEPVTGVTEASLLINDLAATSVQVVSPLDYVFTFTQPPNGPVHVSWSNRNGIADLAGNPFSGTNWDYTLDTSIPPPRPLISEFLAGNDTGIRDEDADRSDWIELYNPILLPVNLDGWFLTDSSNNLAKWRFPSVTLDSHKYLLVWASSKNRTNPAAPLHTNFKLSKDGSFLGLVDPSTNLVFAFSPTYPPQRDDVSYGVDVNSPEFAGYYAVPTPGDPNSTSGSGFAPEPVFSKSGGFYTNSSVAVSISAPSGQIRYTLDGSVPTETSPLYSSALTITTSRTLKARVFSPGLLPSAIIAENYFFLDSTVAKFTSEVPIIVFSTSGNSIQQNVPPGQPRTFAAMAALDTYRGKSSTQVTPDFFGQCELEVRGQTSSGFPKLPYNVELQNPSRNDLNHELLGLPSGSDWALINPYSDKPFLQNFLAMELFEKMGHYAVRRRFVEVFMKTGGGKISYPRDYVGLYLLQEKIKIDNNRVEIAKLTPNDDSLPNISGGYIFKKDKDSTGDLNFSTQGGAGFSGQNLKIHDPKPREITQLQLGWLRAYLNQMERALYASNWKTATGTNHYSAYLDVDSFVDYHWIVEYAKQIDGYRLSNYMHKDRNGKVKMEPIWDWNLSFGNANYLDGYITSGWYYKLIGENDHIWLRRLISGTTSADGTSGDPDFNQRIADRWSQLRTNVLAASNVLARIDEMAALLNNAANRDFQKWPRLGVYVWPNPDFYANPTTYAGIISAMKTWVQGRYNWIDSQFMLAPQFQTPPGRVPRNFAVELQGTGTIYYTTDGSDPRLAGGSLSPKAVLYSGPFTVPSNLKVFARIRNGSKWSGPLAGNFVVEPNPIKITEIMFHPAPPPIGAPWIEDDYEFIELANTGSNDVNLGGYRFTQGIELTLPDYTLPPGGRGVVVKNRPAFESRYQSSLGIIGEYIGSLDNKGEKLKLIDNFGETVADFSYEDDWYPITDGSGFSLVLRTDQENTSDKDSWSGGSTVLGTPGTVEPVIPIAPRVVISELLPNAVGTNAPALELQNLSDTPADISGWFISDDIQKPIRYRIPAGTILAPGAFLVINTSEFNNGPNVLDRFSFSDRGENVYLFSGDSNTNLSGYVHGFSFGPQNGSMPFARFVDSAGREHFAAESAVTLGGSNALPYISPIVISEVMYHPPDVPLNGTNWNNTEHEYIEIQNQSNGTLPLFDPDHATNSWQISGAVKFNFPQGISLAAGESALLVSFDPDVDTAQLTAFRARYSISGSTLILGPFAPDLPNSDGKIELLAPATPITSGGNAGTVPYLLQDSLNYKDSYPWNSGADGIGFALTRIQNSMFGDDPANWTASAPTPGSSNMQGNQPVIQVQPIGKLALQSQNVQLSVTATGEALFYQWLFNGTQIPGANSSSLTLNNIQPPQGGTYSVIVFTMDHAVSSLPARVIVGLDGDADQMDDNWEFKNGLNPFQANDAQTDSDNDAYSNLAEYIAGTNPHDPQDFLALIQSAPGNSAGIVFKAKPDRTYGILYSDDLLATNWNVLTNIPNAGNERMISLPGAVETRNRFFRIVTPAP